LELAIGNNRYIQNISTKVVARLRQPPSSAHKISNGINDYLGFNEKREMAAAFNF
jgi:hypothetical protein